MIILVAFAALVGILFLAQRILMPKYVSSLQEGALIREYYESETNHDIVIFGDCEAYTSFVPSVLKDEFGLECFVRGSAAQRIAQSYYLMEETFSRETPGAVLYSVYAGIYNEPAQEEYNRLTLDGMKWSEYKKNAILASANEDEHLITYMFPILRYHSRWKKLTGEDFKYMFKQPVVSDCGYLPHDGAEPVDNLPVKTPLGNYDLPESTFEYLDKMVMLCKKHGTDFILFKAPNAYPYWYEEWDEQIKEYAGSKGITYYNYLDRLDEIGIDYATDTYDAGQHLNDSGAAKLTRYFAGQLYGEEKIGYAFTFERDDNNVVSLMPGDIFTGLSDNDAKLISYYEADSCAFSGKDKIYTYNDFEVTTNDSNIITRIKLTDDRYATAKGVCIGMSEAQVKSAYGDCVAKGGEIVYKKGDTKLCFVINDGYVVAIEYDCLL